MPAVIRVAGERQLLAKVVAACELPFIESAQSRRKRKLNAGAREIGTSYNLTVSESDGDSVPMQVLDVEAFLNANEQRLDNLLRSIPRCHCTIDFSWDFPAMSAGQFNCFPAALLARLSVLGIDLMVCVYATSENAVNYPMQASGEAGRFEVDNQQGFDSASTAEVVRTHPSQPDSISSSFWLPHPKKMRMDSRKERRQLCFLGSNG